MINVTKSMHVVGDTYNMSNSSKSTYSKGINYSLVLGEKEVKVLPLTGLSVVKSLDIVSDGKVGMNIGGLSLTGDSLSRSGECIFANKLTLTNMGRNITTYEILSVEGLDDEAENQMYEITLNNSNFEQATFTSPIVDGPFSQYEGQTFLLVTNGITEASVLLSDIGTLDELGRKYVYDPSNDNMEFRFTEEGISYGRYKVVHGDIFANALQRCINRMMGLDYCTVDYAGRKFVMTINSANCEYFSIRNNGNFYLATKMGFDAGRFVPADKSLKGCLVCVEDRVYEIVSSRGERIVVKDSHGYSGDKGNHTAGISQFAEAGGSFGSMCTDVHCNVSGFYRVYTNESKPEMYADVQMISGVLYSISCWKLLSGSGDVLTSDDVVIFWDKVTQGYPDVPTIEWPDGFISPRYIDIVTPGAVNVSVFAYGD